VDEVQEQRSRRAAEELGDHQSDDDGEDENWPQFFARLLERGFQLPSDDDDA